jgi:hypothetical protein
MNFQKIELACIVFRKNSKNLIEINSNTVENGHFLDSIQLSFIIKF